MFGFIHKIKPFINTLLKITGLYVVFHTLVVKMLSKRERLSKKYIKGRGLEIGALHTPLHVYNTAKVTYIDWLPTSKLRGHYPELARFPFVKVGIVDNGETLKKIKDNSQDFVIANHFIEHCENPILTLKNHLRVLKPDGILYWSVPDMRYTFDHIRKQTTFQHLEKDFISGPAQSRKSHYDEWVQLIGTERGGKTRKTATLLMKEHYSIHFHTWTKQSFEEFINKVQKKYHFPFIIREVVPNINEFICILQKI